MATPASRTSRPAGPARPAGRERADRRTIVVVAGAQVATALGYYAVMGHLTAYLRDDVGVLAGTIGLVLGTRFLVQSTLQPLLGALTDVLGPARAAALACLLRTASFALLACADAPAGLLTAAALLGAGGALYVPAAQALIVRMSPGRRPAGFAAYLAGGQVTAAIAPLAGLAVLHAVGFGFVSAGAALCLAIAATLFGYTIWSERRPTARKKTRTTPGVTGPDLTGPDLTGPDANNTGVNNTKVTTSAPNISAVDITIRDTAGPDTTGPDAALPNHADERHADERHADERHADGRHADERHADERHTDEPHTDARRTDKPHTDARRTDGGNLPGSAGTGDRTVRRGVQGTFRGMTGAARDRRFRGFVLATAASLLLAGATTSVVPLTGAGAGTTTGFFCLAAAATAAVQPWCAARERAGRPWVLQAGMVLMGGCYLALLVSSGPVGVLVAAVLNGVGQGLMQPAVFAAIARYAPPERVGAHLGLYAFVSGIAVFGGDIVVGNLFDAGPAGAATALAALAALGPLSAAACARVPVQRPAG